MDRLDAEGLTQVIDRAFADRPPDDGRFDVVYERLRAMATRMIENDRAGRDLGASDLVHEAFMRLRGTGREGWRDRRQFFAAASEAMRRALVDHAREMLAKKRGGDRRRVSMDAVHHILDAAHADARGVFDAGDRTLLIDEIINALESLDADRAEVVKLRFFGGLGFDAIGELQGCSERQARRRCEAALLALGERFGRERSDTASDAGPGDAH